MYCRVPSGTRRCGEAAREGRNGRWWGRAACLLCEEVQGGESVAEGRTNRQVLTLVVWPSPLQVDLCVQLNAPLLGPPPGVAAALSRKVGMPSAENEDREADPKFPVPLPSPPEWMLPCHARWRDAELDVPQTLSLPNRSVIRYKAKPEASYRWFSRWRQDPPPALLPPPSTPNTRPPPSPPSVWCEGAAN